MGRRRSRRRRQARRIRLIIMLAVLAGVVYFLLPYCCVLEEVTVEAGEVRASAGMFLKWENKNARLVSGVQEDALLNHVGDYDVVVRVYGRDMSSVLHIRDTVAPEVVTQDVTLFGGGSVEIEDFLVEIKETTPYSVRFVQEPDCVTEGVSTVSLEVQDEGGNVTVAQASLRVVYDTEPPVIHGVSELYMTAGGSISYKKGITVTDDYDQDVRLDVDTSRVDTGTPGDYTVIYNAVDSAGNAASVSTVLHVEPVTIDTVTEEIIYAEADKVLETILNDSMSQYEKAKAIYDWCHDRISYSDGTPKGEWVQGAYNGIVERKGDCYVYAATAKCLLTRAGIPNMDIEKIPSDTMHYWNLIDLGDGWHHFDTCRRKDGSTFFYKTDAELMEYSLANDNSHNYNRDLYPEIK